jgi:hypothetical protein
LWLRQFGTTGGDNALGVAVDPSGNILVAGATQGTLGGETNAGQVDAFLRKYDSDGIAQWTRLIGTSASDGANNVAVDFVGNAYLVGNTLGNLGGQTNSGGNDGFLTKYDADGGIKWTRLLGSAADDTATDVAVDGLGNVYASGYTTGSYGGPPTVGSADAFLAKFDAAGNSQWVRRLSSSKLDWNAAVTIDPWGNIFVAGGTEGNLAGSSGGADAFVSKYDAAGNWVWTTQFGIHGLEEAFDVFADSLGYLYLTGYTSSDLGGQTNAGLGDAFLTKVSAAGNVEWTRLIGAASNEVGWNVAASDSGRVFVTGSTDGSLDGVANGGQDDAFLAEFDVDGNRASTRLIGSAGRDFGRALALTDGNDLVLAGHTYGALDGTNLGWNDAFVAKFGDSDHIAGDFNSDGVIDGVDLTTWQDGFGSGATAAEGDADGDRDVDGADFLVWQRQLGSTSNVAATAAVPEPGVMVLLASAALAMFTRLRAAVS